MSVVIKHAIMRKQPINNTSSVIARGVTISRTGPGGTTFRAGALSGRLRNLGSSDNPLAAATP
jgi:hypothetical protein